MMGFIIDGIANVFFELTVKFLAVILNTVGFLRLDIGSHDFPGPNFENSLNWVIEKSGDAENQLNTFDFILGSAGGAKNFATAFMVTAYVLLFTIFLLKLLTSMLGPITGSSEDPIALTISTGIAGFLIWWSYSIFSIFQGVANNVLDLFRAEAAKTNVNPKKNYFNAFDVLKDPNKLVKNEKGTDFYYLSKTGEITGGKEDNGLATTVIALMLFFMILINLVKLFLEMFERYVVLGLMYYTAPLAFATIGSRSTQDIFKSWVRMLVSQFLLMMMNVFFISVFAASFMNLLQHPQAGSYLFYDFKVFLTWSLIWTGWLIVGQKVDQHLQSLGMSTAQSGGSLAAAAIGAGSVIYGTIRGAASFSRRTVNAGKNMGMRGADAAYVGKSGGSVRDMYRAFSGDKEVKKGVARTQEKINNLYKYDAEKGKRVMDMQTANSIINDRYGARGEVAKDIAQATGADKALKAAGLPYDSNTQYRVKNGEITGTNPDGKSVTVKEMSGVAPNSGYRPINPYSKSVSTVHKDKGFTFGSIPTSDTVKADQKTLKTNVADYLKKNNIDVKPNDLVMNDNGTISWTENNGNKGFASYDYNHKIENGSYHGFDDEGLNFTIKR